MSRIKFLLIMFAVALLLPAGVFARQEQKGIHEPGTGQNSVEEVEIEELEVETTSTEAEELEEVEEDFVEPELKRVRLQDGTGNMEQVREREHEPGAGLAEPMLYGNAEQAQVRAGGPNERALQRRSQVANAVQEMVKVADRNGGVGERIRLVAQEQNQLQEEAEESLAKAQNRSRFTRFFIGPNYGKLKSVEDRLEMHNEKLEELKTLREEVNLDEQALLDEQIEVMEIVTEELEGEVNEDQKGFSLFGWLNRLIRR